MPNKNDFSRTHGLITPNHTAELNHTFLLDNTNDPYKNDPMRKTQPVNSPNIFNMRNQNRIKPFSGDLNKKKLRKTFNMAKPSSGTLSQQNEPTQPSLQPAKKSGFFKVSSTTGRQSKVQGQFQFDMSSHIENCKKIRKNFVQNGILDYDVNQISMLNF